MYLFERDLDVSEALRVAGVVDVITSKDIPGQKVRTLCGYDEELLAEKEVLSVCVKVHAIM